METKNETMAEVAPAELTLTRMINAPVETVFRAWTDPVQVAKWWGPKDFTNPVCELDTRPGGKIKIDMTGPDGTAYPMGGLFHEIDEPRKLVFTSTAFADENGNNQLEVLNTIVFEDHNGKTKLTLTAAVKKATPAVAAPVAGMHEGWSQSLDRLTALVS